MTSSLNSISNVENQVTENNCELPPDSPLISVIVPCYNHGKFLKECVESVINQTYKNWECIIVNDGSTDNTSQEAISLINYYSNCRIFFLEKPNTGVAETRNAGVEKSSGEFVLFLDADDKIHANFLKDAVNILQSHSQVGFVYTDIQHFGVRNDCVSHGDFKPSQFLRSNQATVTSLFRKQIYSQISGFKKEMEAGLEDWEFWVSAYEKGWQGYRLPKAYLYYRQHLAGSRLQNLLTSQAQQKIQFAKIISLHYQLYEKEEIDWAKEILSQEKSLLLAEKLDSDFLDNLVYKIEHYQQNNSGSNTLKNQLRQIRQQIAEEWLSKPVEQLATSYDGTLGKVSQLLLSSGLKIECLNDNEKSFVDEVIANLTTHFDEPVAVKYLLAAMLYRDAYQLPMPIDLSFIPQWFLSDYLKFVLQSPPFFKERGEVDTYFMALKQWINYLHDAILSNDDSAIAKQLAFYFAESANFLCLYSQKENFQETFLKAAKIIEYFLKTSGSQIDWEFPLISTKKKLKLGVLTPPLMPSLETFVSLPVYEYISREFEVILYSFTQTGHSIEQYCQSCANSFKKLPTNLTEAVNLIRNEDLDILYIAANTNVIDAISLLAAHRLARVQITNSLSVFNTGIKQIDYYIILNEVNTPEKEQYNQENFIKIDNFYHCFSYGESAEVASFKINRENLGIPENSIVFVSTANFFSVTPEVIKTWSEILANVKNSILVILPFTQNAIKSYIKNAFLSYVKNEFNKNNIPSAQMIVLDPPNPSREDIKECLKLGNIYLDSLPSLDIGFIIEALEIKLPIITKQGMYFPNSIGSSLLQTLEISQLITHTEETYIQQAINLATNRNLRQKISQEIGQKMQAKPSFLDSQSYAAKLAPVFKKTLQQYYAKTLPQIFKLREINLIIFPDWNKSENILFQELLNVLRIAINHPQKYQITLLIESNNISEETADLTLSSIIIELLMNEDLDVVDGPEISFLSNLSKIHWEALLPKINGRIILENENQQSLAQVQSNKILIGYNSDSLSQTTFVL